MNYKGYEIEIGSEMKTYGYQKRESWYAIIRRDGQAVRRYEDKSETKVTARAQTFIDENPDYVDETPTFSWMSNYKDEPTGDPHAKSETPRKRLVVDEHHDEIVEEIEMVEAQDEQIEIIATFDNVTKAQYKGRTIYVNANAVNKGSHTDSNIRALPVLINFAGVELKSESVEKGLSSAKAIIDRWSKPSPFQSQA